MSDKDSDAMVTPLNTPPVNSYQREDAIRLVQSGIDNPTDGRDDDDFVALNEPITRILDNNQQIDRVEFIKFPGDQYPEHIVTGHATAPAGADPATVDPAATALEDHLPTGIGIEAVTIDFRSLDNIVAETARLIIEKNRSLPKYNHITYNPFKYYHNWLDKNGIDYIYQVIVEEADAAAYAITVRLAATGELPIDDIDPAKCFDGLKSNRNLRVPLFYLKEGLKESRRKKLMRSKIKDRVKSIQRLLKQEYSDLLRGRTDFPAQLVDASNGYAKFGISGRQLNGFVGYMPTENSWSARHDHPKIITTDIIQDAAGTHQSISEQDPTPTPQDSVVNAGGTTHQELERLLEQTLRKNDWDIKRREQTSESIPDGVANPPKDSQINLHDPTSITTPQDDKWAYNIEIECEGPTNGSNALTNIVRAEKQGRGVIILTKNEKMANRVHEQVLRPYKSARNDQPGVKLYTQDKITTPANTTPVVRDADYDTQIASDWWLHPDGTLELEIDGVSITSGQATDSVTTFEYDYYLDERDGTYVIIDDNDEEVMRYSSRSRLNAEWTRIHAPFVPTRLTYVDRCTILYHDKGSLEICDPQPTWDHPKASVRYEQAITAFLQRHTVERRGATLTQASIRSQVNGWYRVQTDDDGIPPNWFGRSLPESDRQRSSDDESGRWALPNRDWIYPPGLDSPDLPDFKLDDAAE